MRRRIESRASGGVPKKPLKKARCLLVGWARVKVQAVILPPLGTLNGSLAWPLLSWKPVTLPTAWQGSSGQEGSGVVAVSPRTTVVRVVLAAPAPATRAMRTARQPAVSVATAMRPRLRAGLAAMGAPCEDLDMPLLLS